MGLKLTKVHCAIKFQQSPWMAKYIMKNQALRANAQNEFETEFFKLMNNAVFGKTCENQKKRTDIKLVNDEHKFQLLANKPNFMDCRIFSEDLTGVELQKLRLLINKPFYVGFTVLELAKLHMYQFHYDYFMKKYPEAKLLFTDTDSLYYEVETEDIEKELFERGDLFDYSDYPVGSPYRDETNKKVAGNFKCETKGASIIE